MKKIFLLFVFISLSVHTLSANYMYELVDLGDETKATYISNQDEILGLHKGKVFKWTKDKGMTYQDIKYYENLKLYGASPKKINALGQILLIYAEGFLVDENGKRITSYKCNVNDVNDFGTYVGFASYPNSEYAGDQPCIWDSNGSVHVVDTLASYGHKKYNHTGLISSVNNLGNSVGFATITDGFLLRKNISFLRHANGTLQYFDHHSYIDPSTRMWKFIDLDLYPTLINDHNDVLFVTKEGNEEVYLKKSIYFYWDSAKDNFYYGDTIKICEKGFANSFNIHADVVGWVMKNGCCKKNAFIWTEDHLYLLKDLIINFDNKWELEEAMSINDKGQIVGCGSYHHDLYHISRRAFLLVPTDISYQMLHEVSDDNFEPSEENEEDNIDDSCE